ncbi:Tetratricopeptide repeat protein 14 [Bulinus truncatus]|nr:Tetratricopeptide repeat protein 14 [Bulinus truncatus]
MDTKLVGQALQSHGVDLLSSLKREQQDVPSSAIEYLENGNPVEPEIKDVEFRKKLISFIARKSDLLFESFTRKEKDSTKNDEKIDDSYAIMPAVELFMEVPPLYRRQHFFESIRSMDCVTGMVTSMSDNGLRIQLLCVDKGCARDIDDLNILAFCPVKDLPKLYAHESALEAFQVKDIVRGIIMSVDAQYEKVTLSLHERSIPDKNLYPRIGLITEDEFPVYFRRKAQIQGMFYEEMMESVLGFSNQGNVKTLLNLLGIQQNSSFFRSPARGVFVCLFRLKIPEKEYAEGLRKWQSQKLAHLSLVQGVDMFKQGKYLEAMQHLNRALQIDKENVEALVARGALYANQEHFSHAIKDFQEALEINPKHGNAKTYLTETLLTAGKSCEDRRQLEEACDYYSQVLKVEPSNKEAQEMLTGCQRLMAFQTVASDGSKKKFLEDRSKTSVLSKTAEKLKLLIQEDEKEKPSSSKKKKHLRRSDSNSSSKKKRKRRKSTSSSSDESSSSSSVSSGETKKYKKRPSKVIQGASTSSYLPVTSSEYFSTSASIPGLGSPPPAEDKSAGHQGGTKLTMNAERIADVKTMKRRDELLMAEREKFYKDNKERYKRFRPHSRSRSSSTSSSSSLSRSSKRKQRMKRRTVSRSTSRSRSKDRRSSRRTSQSSKSSYKSRQRRYKSRDRSSSSSSRSRSRGRGSYDRSSSRDKSKLSPGRHRLNRNRTRSKDREPVKIFSNFWCDKKSPPPITGLKELDMYLGGARNYFNKIKEREHTLLGQASSRCSLSRKSRSPETQKQAVRSPNVKRLSRSGSKDSPKRRKSSISSSNSADIKNSPRLSPSKDKTTHPLPGASKSNISQLRSSDMSTRASGFGKFGPSAKSLPDSSLKPASVGGNDLDEIIFKDSVRAADKQGSTVVNYLKSFQTAPKDFLPRVLVKSKTDESSTGHLHHQVAEKEQRPDLKGRKVGSSSPSNTNVSAPSFKPQISPKAEMVVPNQEKTDGFAAGNKLDSGHSWSNNYDLEKEIERRVQERLRQEENKKRMDREKYGRGLNKDDDESGSSSQYRDVKEHSSIKNYDPFKSRMYADMGEHQYRKYDKYSPSKRGGRGRGAFRGWGEKKSGNYFHSNYRPASYSRDYDKNGSGSSFKYNYRPGYSSRNGRKDKSRSSSEGSEKSRSRSRSKEFENNRSFKESVSESSARSKSNDRNSLQEKIKPKTVSPEKSLSPVNTKKDKSQESLDCTGLTPVKDESLLSSQWESTSTDVNDRVSPCSPVATSKWETLGSSGKDSSGDAEDSSKKAESLTELEKFLVDLKHQKKKQWIAEGKLKNKE